MLDDLTELPEGWSLEIIEDLCDINPKHDKSVSDELEISFIPMPAIDEITGTIREHGVKKFGEVKKGYTHFADRDVIFAKITPCMENGKAAIGENLINGLACGSTEFYVLRSKGGVLPEYIYNFIRQPGYREIAQQSMSGAVGHQRVPKEFLLETEIPLPPLNEQKRIVAKIEELRSHTQAARNAIAHIPKLLEQFRQSVLAAAFRGDLTAEWRSENPDVEPAEVLLKRIHTNQISNRKKGKRSREAVANIRAEQVDFKDCPNIWKVIQLGDICQLQTGYAFKSSHFTSDGIRLLRGVNVAPSNIRWDDVVCISRQQATEFQDYELFENDLVIAMDRPVISTGLKIARLKLQDLPSLLLQRVGRFKLEPEVDADFIFTYLSSHIFLSHIQGQATGTQLPHISASDIETAVIPFLPIEEQKEIVKQIKLAFEKIDRIEQQYKFIKTELDRLDRSILAKAFKGELVPQDPTDEPAIVLLERIRGDRASQVKPAKTKRKKA